MKKIQLFFSNNYTLVSLTIVAIALRLYHLTSISLWHDEAFSALLIRYPWKEMMYRIGLDVHPPMYYIFLRVWHYIFGNSLWSLRGFSVFFGVGTVVATYYLVKTVFRNHRAAVIATTLVAISPFQLQYVTEARMYTMGAFFAVVSALLLVKALEWQKQWYLSPDKAIKNKYLWAYLGYTLCTIIIIYTHYYLLFTAAAICFYGLTFHISSYKWQFKKYGLLLLSYIIVAVSFLPWLKVFLFQFRQVGGNYWIPPMDRWSIPDTLWRLIIGLYTSVIPNHILLVAMTLITLIVLYFVIRKIAIHEKWLIILNVIAPFAGSLLFLLISRLKGEHSSVYLVRYFLFSSTFLLIAVALFIENLKPKRIQQTIFGLLIIINLFAFIHYWVDLDVSHKPGMAAAAQLLQTNVEPSHKIYIGSSFEFFNYKYYNQTANKTSVKPLLYTNGQTEVDKLPHYAGTAILTNDDLVPDFKANTHNGDTVWLLWTNGFGGSKPETPANWTQIDEHGYADVRPYVGTFIIVTEYKVN